MDFQKCDFPVLVHLVLPKKHASFETFTKHQLLILCFDPSLTKINYCSSTSVFYSTISRHLLHRWLHFDFAKKQLIYKGLQLQMLSNNTDLIFTIYLSFWWNSSSAFCGLIAIDSSFEPLYPKVFRGTPKNDLVSTVWRPGPAKVR